jgi:hypothetical protein
MWPSLGRVSPLIRLNSVVLPAPFGPMIAGARPRRPSAHAVDRAEPPNSFESGEVGAAAAGSPSAELAGRKLRS